MIKLPLPPSFMLTLWGNDEAFIKKYLTDNPGFYTTGDAGQFDERGYLHIMTRVDDVINTAGHRISTGRLEEVVNSHEDVVESAVVARVDEIRGECPFAFVVLRGDLGNQVEQDKEKADALQKEKDALRAPFAELMNSFKKKIESGLEKKPKNRI